MGRTTREELKKIKEVMTLTTDLFGYINYDLTDLSITNNMLNFYFYSKYSERWCSPVIDLLLDDGEIPVANLATLGDYINQLYKPKWDRLKNILLLEYDPIHNYLDEMVEDTNDSETIQQTGQKSNQGTKTRTDNLVRTDATRQTDNYIKDDNYQNEGSEKTINTGDSSLYGFDSDDEPAPSDWNDSRTSTNRQANNFGTTQRNETITNTGTVSNTGTVTNNDLGSESNSSDSERNYERDKTVTHKGNIGNLSSQNLLGQEVEFWQWNFVNQMLSDVADVLTLSIY